MACFLPFHPSAPARILGSSKIGALAGCPVNSSSPALRRHLSASCPQAPPCSAQGSRSTDENPSRTTPRLSFLALQHPRIEAPFFSLQKTSEASETCCRTSRKSHPQGLATLSMAFSSPRPLEASSASHTLGLRPSELFSTSGIEKNVSAFFFRSGSSLPTHFGLAPELQRLSLPPKQPCPLLPPGRFRSGRGLLLSWAF
jgi:hypothetical protein